LLVVFVVVLEVWACRTASATVESGEAAWQAATRAVEFLGFAGVFSADFPLEVVVVGVARLGVGSDAFTLANIARRWAGDSFIY